MQYADFTCWQRRWLSGDVLERQLSYWKNQLSSDLPRLLLPTDRSRPPMQSYQGARSTVSLPQPLLSKLKSLSQREDVTLFMTLLAAFKALLYRYSNQNDIVVGTLVANRNHPEIEDLIGFFVNTLVLRTSVADTASFREMVKQVRKTALEAYEHQDLPFEKLVEVLQMDHQVKVRGFRIELGEIESVLAQHPGVKQSVVTVTEMGEADTRLVAYVIHESNRHPTVSELRKFLRENLPSYMVPSIFMTVDAFPLSPNGKVEHRRLPLPSGMQQTGSEYIPPRSETERCIAAIWQQLLGVDRVSLIDNFFDLGGHSLLSMKVLYRIEQEFGLQISPREIIFRNLKQFAALCEEYRNSAPSFSRKNFLGSVKAALSTN